MKLKWFYQEIQQGKARQGVELQALVFKLSGKKRNKTRGTIHRHKTPRTATLDDLSNGGGGGMGGGGVPGNREK